MRFIVVTECRGEGFFEDDETLLVGLGPVVEVPAISGSETGELVLDLDDRLVGVETLDAGPLQPKPLGTTQAHELHQPATEVGVLVGGEIGEQLGGVGAGELDVVLWTLLAGRRHSGERRSIEDALALAVEQTARQGHVDVAGRCGREKWATIRTALGQKGLAEKDGQVVFGQLVEALVAESRCTIHTGQDVVLEVALVLAHHRVGDLATLVVLVPELIELPQGLRLRVWLDGAALATWRVVLDQVLGQSIEGVLRGSTIAGDDVPSSIHISDGLRRLVVGR